MKKSNLSQKEILLKSILKNQNKIENNKKISNTNAKVNSKGNIDIKEKNRKSQ
jgi:hypothetical protein